MAAANEQHRAAIDLEEKLGRWPRRLLHVPSMTSHKWQPGNLYGNVAEPKYNAISYTWGRFRETDTSLQVPTLQVNGIEWSIPMIKPGHFDVAKLEAVIRKSISDSPETGGRIEYIWIDVACIDQRGNIDSDLEIGRQAQIFGHAHRVYVWLGHSPTRRLEELHEFWSFWKCMYDQWSTGRYDQDALSQAQGVLARFNEEPWFSSVWTLQEAYLRKDAVLLSDEGESLAINDTHSMNTDDLLLKHILEACDAVWLLCWSGIAGTEPEEVTLQLRDLGIVGLNRNDPMRLYTTAMSRHPSNEEDCIYGIQQIFDLRLGKSNPSNMKASYSLEELEDELGAALLRTCPVMSQNFVHRDSTTRIGKRWRLSRSLENPHMPFNYDSPWSPSDYTSCCTLRAERIEGVLCGHFDGRVCDFILMQKDWTSWYHDTSRPQPSNRPLVSIQLDIGSELFARFPSWELPNPGHGVAADEIVAVATAELLVKCISQDYNPDSYDSRSLIALHMGEDRSFEGGCQIGLLLFRSKNEPLRIWRRVGICAWPGPNPSTNAWESQSGYFG